MQKVAINHRKRSGYPFPTEYASLIGAWDTNGLLATDACWVPPDFTIPRDFASCRSPARSEILLIYEHEDESAVYRDAGTWSGTNMTAVLDEIRKIGNVRSDLKVVSYITSQEEIEAGSQVAAVQSEVRLIRDPAALTREWVILQIGRYLRPASQKLLIRQNQVRHVFIRMTVTDAQGAILNTEDRCVPSP